MAGLLGGSPFNPSLNLIADILSRDRPQLGVNRYPFLEQVIMGAPDAHGIYRLYDAPELIYIGRAAGLGVTIRSRLLSHFRGNEGVCTQIATHYEWEITDSPSLTEALMLSQYERLHGRLPRCNQRIG